MLLICIFLSKYPSVFPNPSKSSTSSSFKYVSEYFLFNTCFQTLSKLSPFFFDNSDERYLNISDIGSLTFSDVLKTASGTVLIL